MNKLKLRRVQEEDILTDILISLQNMQEDYSFDKNSFPVTLGMFTFNTYNLQDLLLINESFKSEVFYIRFLGWFLHDGLDDSRLEPHHNSQKDVTVGYLSINTIKEGISKTDNRLLKLQGQDNTTNINNITFIIGNKSKEPTHFFINDDEPIKLRKLDNMLKFYRLYNERKKIFNTKAELDNFFKPLKSEKSRPGVLGYKNSNQLILINQDNHLEIMLKNPKIIRIQ